MLAIIIITNIIKYITIFLMTRLYFFELFRLAENCTENTAKSHILPLLHPPFSLFPLLLKSCIDVVYLL